MSIHPISHTRLIALLAIVSLLAGAGLPATYAREPGTSLQADEPGFDEAAWAQRLRADRTRVDSILAHSPLSPFAAIGQTVLQPGKPLRVVLSGDTLLLGHPSADPGLPQLEFLWRKVEGMAYVRTPNTGRFTLNGRSIGPVPQPVTSSDTVFAEDYLLKVYASERSARVRAFHPGGTGQRAYHGQRWFEPDARFRVTAHVEPAARDTVIMPTSAGLEKAYIRHSRVRFAVDGNPAELTLFAPASDPEAYGFLPFTDASSGDATYGGGRYLDMELPAVGQTELLIDFNEAYNPLCAYVPHYNCPIPPAENALELAIEAGERAYHEDH